MEKITTTKDKIKEFLEKELKIHTDWTGSGLELKHRNWSIEDITNAMFEYLKENQVEDEQPEHSKIVETYIVGKNPKWKVGDTLAYYDLTTDREGEQPLGKIASIEYDEYLEDWVYVFDNNSSELEETLLDIEAYIIKTK